MTIFENLILKKSEKNIFFYKQFFNVKNDNSVQNAINRSDYRNKSKIREYRENRRRENKISRKKTKKFTNNNFIDFSKINGFKCRKKTLHS